MLTLIKKLNQYIKENKPLVFSLTFAVLYTSVTFAAPYLSSDAILNPTCAPGDVDCYVSLYPDQTGNSGKFLTTNGTTTSWNTITTTQAIGDAITNATEGSILFAGSGGTFAQDNSNFFFDDTNNRLGVGTASPSAKLSIDTPTNYDGIRLTNSGYALAQLNKWADEGGYLELLKDNSAFSRIQYDNSFINSATVSFSGNVGIGTSSPVAKLSVQGDYDNTGTGGILLDAYSTVPGRYDFRINPYVVGSGNVGYNFHINNNGSSYDAMSITGTGRIGIGTTSPGYKLDVKDVTVAQARFYGSLDGSASDAHGQILLGSSAGYYGSIGYSGAGGKLFLENTYEHDASQVVIRVHNTASATIDAVTVLGSGNVGIGTTNPVSKLQINNGTGISQLGAGSSGADIILSTGGGVYASSILSSSFGPRGGGEAITFIDWDATPLMTIITATGATKGNVGIGTASPTARLHVAGSGATSGTTSFLIRNSTPFTTMAIDDAGSVVHDNINWNNSTSVFKVSGAGNQLFNVNSDGTTTVGADGATTFPLYVYGNSGLQMKVGNGYLYHPNTLINLNNQSTIWSLYNSAGSSSALSLSSPTFTAGYDSTTRDLLKLSSTWGNNSGTQTGNYLHITDTDIALSVGAAIQTLNFINIDPVFNTTNGSTIARGIYYNPTLTSTTGLTNTAIETVTGNVLLGTTSGNVSIGNTNTSYKLQVGSSSVSGIVARFENSTGTCDINPTTTSLSCSSDINLKKNITTLDGTDFILNTESNIEYTTNLDKLLALDVVTYNWNTEDDNTTKHIGFIAQQVESVYPDLVTTDINTNLKSLNITNLTPYIIKGIQELDKKITSIETLEENSNFINTLRNWLASASNGISKIFANKVQTNELCVGEVCVTESQFLQLIQNSQTSYQSAPPEDNTSNQNTEDENIQEDETLEETPEESIDEQPIEEPPMDEVIDQEDTVPAPTLNPDSTQDPLPAQE